jgi:protein-S-isoprenylcysteine O-methyltransferase Ste14
VRTPPTHATANSGSLLYSICSRVPVAGLFAVVAVIDAQLAVATSSTGVRVHQSLSAVLWGMFAVLVVVRPTPVRRGTDVNGVLVALAAQAGVVLLGLVARGSGSGVALATANVLLAGGELFAIGSLSVLGRCFGVLPDVRGLVTRGPYRFVRHPLYLGELVAVLGIAVGSQRWAMAVPLWVLCAALQLLRTRYEERALRVQYPEYELYAQRTKRLIPGLV